MRCLLSNVACAKKLHATKHWINLNLLAFTQRNTPAGQVLRRMRCGRSGAAEEVPRRYGGHRRPTPLTAAGTLNAHSKAPPEMPQPVPRAASFCWCRRTPRHFPGSRAAAHGAPSTAPGPPPSRRRPWGGEGGTRTKTTHGPMMAPGDLGPPRGYCRGLTSCRGMWRQGVEARGGLISYGGMSRQGVEACRGL